MSFLRLAAALVIALTLAACGRPAGPALWRIADADSEIWLFGSVHALPPDVRWRTPRIDDAFAHSEVVMFEADARVTPAFAALIQRDGVLPPGETLSSRLSSTDQARLARVAQRLGANMETLERQRPWLTAIQLSVANTLAGGSRPDRGVESVLAAEARERGQVLAYLETAESQIVGLTRLSPEGEQQLLSATLRQIDEDNGAEARARAAWLSGDVAAFERLVGPDMAEAGPEATEAILLARNRGWADQIAARLAGRGRTFIAVGAAHLSGPGSVVALLRARGVRVEGP